jgi:hypothetical protein
MKLVWKIHEIARGKGPLSLKLRCATCPIGLEESWSNLGASWNW